MKSDRLVPSRRQRGDLRHRQRGFSLAFALLWPFFLGLGLVVLIAYAIPLWFGKGVKGKLIGSAIATVLLSPIWYPVMQSTQESNRWDEIRNTSGQVCVKELAAMPREISIDSFVDETGGLRSGNIAYLLTTIGLRFVEVELGRTQGITGNEDYSWPATQGANYAHLELGNSDSENCYFGSHKDRGRFFTESPPIRPGICLQVTYLSRPQSKFALTETPSTSHPELTHWVLKDRLTDTKIAGITDAFRLTKYPQPVPRWDIGRTLKSCAHGRDGYAMLLDKVRSTPVAKKLAAEKVLTPSDLRISGFPRTADEAQKLGDKSALRRVRFAVAPYAESRNNKFERPTWQQAYALAEIFGASMYGNQLVIPKTGALLNVSHDGPYGLWGTTGTQLLMAVKNSSSNQLVLYGASFQGNILWTSQTGLIEPEGYPDGIIFDPEMLEMTKKYLLIHGTDQRSRYSTSRQFWTISIPLSDLKALEKAGSSHGSR